MLKFTWACFDWFWTISGPVSFFRSWTRYTKLLFCDIGLLVWILSESCNENHGQWERYKRHISNVSMTPVNIISALHIELQWLRCRFLLVTQEKSSVKRMKHSKGCFGSDVVARRMRSHMTLLDTRRQWWRVKSCMSVARISVTS